MNWELRSLFFLLYESTVLRVLTGLNLPELSVPLLFHENSISAMEFTEAYKQTGPCCFSPNARFLAVTVDYRLVIRDVLSLKVFTKLLLMF